MRPEYFWIIDFYIDDPQEEPETLQQVQLAYMKGVKTGLALPRPKEEEESDGPSKITTTSVRR